MNPALAYEKVEEVYKNYTHWPTYWMTLLIKTPLLLE